MNKMEKTIWDADTIRKSKSPFSIYFYLKKTNDNYDEAQKLYQEFLEKKSPFRNKKNRPNTIEYWTNKGYSEYEAKIKISEIQSKPLDLDQYISKYGDKIGLEKYNNRKENYQNRFDTEIKNVQKELNCDYDSAYNFVCQKRRKCSPRTIDYWLNKNYTIDESKKLVSKIQKENSPRSIYYWIKNGYSEDEAIRKVSYYQDNISIESIEKRYNCDKFIALEIQESILEKIKFTRIRNNLNIDICNDYEFFVYKKEVQKETKKTLKLNKKTFTKKNENYSLDHKYSIFWGFYNDVPPKIIGSIHNLEYIPKTENNKKQSKCSIDLKTLIERYENGNSN
jgi:hypothetical protein